MGRIFPVVVLVVSGAIGQAVVTSSTPQPTYHEDPPPPTTTTLVPTIVEPAVLERLPRTD